MRILLVHQELSSFVERDLSILHTAHEVKAVEFRGLAGMPALARGTQWADLTFCWFGKLHAFFAVLFSKMLGKKAIVVAGGDDVAREPSIGYGMFSYWRKKWCPLFVFRYADVILSVSDFNRRETIQNARAHPHRVTLLYHGFDGQKWQRMPDVSKERMVLTVARITQERLTVKGLNLFVRSAAYLPNVPFFVVGPGTGEAVRRLESIAPSNVTFTGGLYGDDLIRMYSRAKVYVQPSVHESFGCSVAEAMLCECVPVVSRRAALPEVVGECGLYVDELTPDAIAGQVRSALRSRLGRDARGRIIRQFPLAARRQQLLQAVEEVHTSEAT